MNKEQPKEAFTKPIWELKPKMHRYPTKRWGHTAVVLNSKLYIYGGKTGKAKESLYQIDCDTYEAHILESSNQPQSRESHSCTLIKQKLVIWGGCHQNKVINFDAIFRKDGYFLCLSDCITITVKDRGYTWVPAIYFPKLLERESHATLGLKDKYIFLYGGGNEDEDMIFDDFWVLNTELDVWFEIKNIINKFEKRLSCTLTLVQNTIYMFGGELQNYTYVNELYKLQFSSMHFAFPDKIPNLNCVQVNPKGRCPPPRSSHCALAYNKYLIILGGEGADKDNNSILLNDMWAYDTVENIWIEIEVDKNIFKPRSCFTASIYKNKILIFGGLVTLGNFKPTDELVVVSFVNQNDNQLSVCSICKLHYAPIIHEDQKKDINMIEANNNFKVGVNSLYKLSRFIKNPLDALSILIDGFNRMNYKNLSINFGSKSITMKGSGYLLHQQEFSDILSNYQLADQIYLDDWRVIEAVSHLIHERNLNIFNANIKNASSRLGDQFILINKRSIMVDMLYITPHSMNYCEVDSEDLSVGEKHAISYEIISKHLKAFNINIGGVEDKSLTILITNLRELKEPHFPDIDKYLKHLFLFETDLEVSINGKALINLNQKAQFMKLPLYEALGPSTNDQYSQFHIKLRENDQITRQSSLVYIYLGNYKVFEFTDLQYPKVEGLIQIPHNKFQMNIMRTKLQPFSQKYLEKSVRAICKEFVSQAGKRKNSSIAALDQLASKKNPSMEDIRE